MEYTVNKLAKISGISTRTLRYYDEIGLLRPARVSSNGYRIYGKEQVDTLQQVLFYRELGVNLDQIKNLLYSQDFDQEKALQDHLNALLQRKEQIELLIENVSKTIGSLKGEIIMSDNEKFEGFKQKLIDENEQKYGKEVREKYGDEAINASNSKIKGMTPEQYAEVEKLSSELNETLKAAFESCNPSGELAQKACELHKKWLCCFWVNGTYSKEVHKALAQGYVDDERFTAYYDKIAPGCAVFLRDAINIYCR